MSVQAISAAFSVRGVSASEKLLLLAVANYADAEGLCWPSQERLAQDTELSERTIRTCLQSLEAAGLLRRERHTRADGSRAADRIYILFLPEAISAPTGKSREAYRQMSPGLPEAVSPLTTFEPSSEPSEEPSVVAAPAKPARDADFEEAWGAYPHVKGRSSKAETFKLFTKLPAKARAGMAAACRRYAAEGREPRADCGAPAMERWIKRGLHENWTVNFGQASTAAPDPLETWRHRMRSWDNGRYWLHDDWGPAPGRPGCQVPVELLSAPAMRAMIGRAA